ncbi:hypothetical protein VCHENC01_4438 [Vibrio harveyi]|nr:hypothetical protein VCHENC01_4438 [Vibrio harveyi]
MFTLYHFDVLQSIKINKKPQINGSKTNHYTAKMHQNGSV